MYVRDMYIWLHLNFLDTILLLHIVIVFYSKWFAWVKSATPWVQDTGAKFVHNKLNW